MRRCLAVDCTGDWRASMRPVYADSVLAWRRLEAAGTGPAAPGETPSTVYFWPDKHGTAGRQLAAALRARDESLTRASDLANKSVGLQSGRATAGGAARRAQASARALGAGAGNGGGLQCPRRGLTR